VSATLSTLALPVQRLQEIKKSRFLAQAAPVTSIAAAMAFLDAIKDPAATHNCWAYRIGAQYRFSDDGEPGGTAGKPILQAIDGQGYDRVMVVVTRWYGGIKLGAGGLVRAYGGCAAECLREAPRIAIVDKRPVRIWVPFAALAPLQARRAEFEAEVQDEAFDAQGVTLQWCLPATSMPALQRLVNDLSRGRAQWRELEETPPGG